MSPAKNQLNTAPAGREIVSTRVFDAPRELVFQAISDPGLLVPWWGPKDFNSTFREFDLRAGGLWRFVFPGLDSADDMAVKNFIEIIYPERIALQSPNLNHIGQMTMTFTEEACKTRLTWRLRFDSNTVYEKARRVIPAANELNFDRLEFQLATMARNM
jgi:uncharacterized protein YndB with AHSA1/START domain